MITDQKLFLRKTAVFIIILVIIVIIINTAYWKIVIEKKNVYRAEKEYLDAIKQNKIIDYAFYGDSHARDSINPKYIDNSFNFGTGDENYIKTYYKVKKLLDNNKEVKRIFLEIDPHSFSSAPLSKQRIMSDNWLYSQFIPIKEIKKITNKSIISIYLESYLPVLGNGEDFAVLFIGKQTDMYYGWYNDTRNFSAENKSLIAQKDRKEQFTENDAFLNPIALEYFEKTIKLVDENHIPITLVRFPLSYEYNQELKKINFPEAEFYNEIAAITNKHLKEYNLLDYHKTYENNSEYFSNSHHLNGAGSIIFSEKINKDIKQGKATN
ncbi:hypothetical protein HZA96_02850 [Candidatus Woesearchaeota archaeon]|nr:hypothetical protein [Candidatus Woesearchaeota archaeon]